MLNHEMTVLEQRLDIDLKTFIKRTELRTSADPARHMPPHPGEPLDSYIKRLTK